MKLRKITALLTSAFIAVTAFTATSFADEPSLSPISFGSVKGTTFADNVFNSERAMNINGVDSIEDSIEAYSGINETTVDIALTETTFSYVPRTTTSNRRRSVANVSALFDATGTLSASNPYDFFPFTLTTDRTVAFGFETENTDFLAGLGVWDTSTGNVTLTSFALTPGTVTWASGLGAGSYCWVVYSPNQTYTPGDYELGMNALNPSGADACITLSSDYSRAVFRYDLTNHTNPSYYIYSNGINVLSNVIDYITDNMTTNTFQDRYEGPSPSNKIATVGVTSGPGYIVTNSNLYYGWYTSTNTSNNLVTGLGHSSYDVVFIPIYGYGYTCSVSGSYINYQLIQDVATGYLVYDLHTESIIDWMSSSNVLYAPNGYFNFEYSYGVYADLDFHFTD